VLQFNDFRKSDTGSRQKFSYCNPLQQTETHCRTLLRDFTVVLQFNDFRKSNIGSRQNFPFLKGSPESHKCVLQCVAVLLTPALLQCVAMVHTAVLLQCVAVLLTAVLYSPCNTPCNTHCNTYCNTHCNTRCNTRCNTHCNTHLSVMPTAALSAFSTPSVLLNFWRQPLYE